MSVNNIATEVIHAGEPHPRVGGAVCLPIFQSAMYETGSATSYHDIKYIRLNNTPNHIAVQEKLAAIERAEAAVVTASGMAAISTALLTMLRAGDHALFQKTLYGGTYDFVTKDLNDFGIDYDFIDADAPDTWGELLRPTTKVIYVESMSNPLLEIGDLEAVVEFARQNGLISMIDNTFPSPFNFRPVEWGFDLSLHSGTKYLNGHSDIVAGAVAGSAELIDRIKRKLDHLGGSLDPHACFLLHRGMRTLAVRMKQHNVNALTLARFLETHPRVLKVNHPGLASHPRRLRAAELFDGFSGMLSFEVDGGVEAADEVISRLQYPISAPSLGGVESLVTRPVTTSHAGLSDEQLQAAGISKSLIRVSVGIEEADDLVRDFAQALD